MPDLVLFCDCRVYNSVFCQFSKNIKYNWLGYNINIDVLVDIRLDFYLITFFNYSYQLHQNQYFDNIKVVNKAYPKLKWSIINNKSYQYKYKSAIVFLLK